MKSTKILIWIAPLALLIAGCTVPVQKDTTISEWQRDGMLPPTGVQTARVYAEPESYPASEPSIIVNPEQKTNASHDMALADQIRQEVQYDRGLTPSLQHVTIEVRDGRVILRGIVKSDLDARVIVDDLRDITGVSRVIDNLEINPNVD
jgi:hypothetical protein